LQRIDPQIQTNESSLIEREGEEMMNHSSLECNEESILKENKSNTTSARTPILPNKGK
jgi:hypothetical protein